MGNTSTLTLTCVDAVDDVAASLGRLEVVDLVVDLKPPDAPDEASVALQEVASVAEVAGAAQKHVLGERDAHEETLSSNHLDAHISEALGVPHLTDMNNFRLCHFPPPSKLRQK